MLAGLLANQSAYQELTLVDQNGQEQIKVSRSNVVADSDLAEALRLRKGAAWPLVSRARHIAKSLAVTSHQRQRADGAGCGT